jgi:hypothetical protein
VVGWNFRIPGLMPRRYAGGGKKGGSLGGALVVGTGAEHRAVRRVVQASMATAVGIRTSLTFFCRDVMRLARSTGFDGHQADARSAN